MHANRGGVYGRVALTLIVAIGALLLARIPVPGVDVSALERLLSSAGTQGFDRAAMGIFAVELNPFISASLLVELLAVAIPRWRAWRLGGYPDRQRLWTRVQVVALVLVLIQAFFLVRWLRRTGEVYPMLDGVVAGSPNDPLMIVTEMLSFVGGAFLLFWLTRVIDSRGCGNGFSVIIVAFVVIPTAQALLSSARHQLEAGERILWPLVVTAVAVAAVTRLTAGRALRPNVGTGTRNELPAPSSGLQPAIITFSLMQLPAQLKNFGINFFPDALASETWTRRGLQAALLAAFCVLFAWLFNRPRLVAQAWQRAGTPEVDAAQIQDRVRAAFARSLAWSLAVCWGLTGAQWMCADAGLTFSVVTVTVVACVAMDVADEVRFRYRHGALARVWPVHRLFLLPGMLHALDAAGIPAFPRGRRHRTLWNFFVPFVPVEILVPADHAGRAESAILGPWPG